MGRLKILRRECEIDSRIQIIEFIGAMGADSVDVIMQSVNDSIAEHRVLIIADLSKSDFISSPAFGELIGCKKRLREENGNMVIVGINTELKLKLNMMGADRIFNFFSNIRSAVMKYNWDNEFINQPIRIAMPADLKYVPAVRQLVSRVAERKGYSRKDSFRLETLVDEVCNNGIEHGDTSEGAFVKIEIFVNKTLLEISVRSRLSDTTPEGINRIRKFLMDDERPRDPDPNAMRGRGIDLIKMLATKTDFDIVGNEIIVKIKKTRED
ncbi:MAG: STAS domain-containing protein [Fibrobacterota bacterium]